jgi:hypothetical protein
MFSYRHPYLRSGALMGLGLTLTMTSALAFSQSLYIPEQAKQYFPVVKDQANLYMPGFKPQAYFGALIEHESCISLKHSKCWNPASRLKTDREEGAGLGQITKAYNQDGSVRFDLLSEMKTRHSDLKELSWSNVYQRPDLQIRAMVLLTKTNFNKLSMIPDNMDRIAMADAAYNGGIGGLFNERRACGLAKGCDSTKWFNNVENYCLKSKKALYGLRSACDINRHHVHDVLQLKLPKYKIAFQE